MGARIPKEILYLRRDFTKDDRLDMGAKLAESYNFLSDIEEEEAVMKSQIKERKSQVAATIGTLSRNLAAGFIMENVDCELIWDSPHVGEVSYKRKDTGDFVKSRAMTAAENQQEIEFQEAVEQAAASKDASVTNIESFFGKPTLVEKPEEEPETDEDESDVDDATAEDAGNSALVDAEEELFASPDPEAAMEAIKPEHDEAWEATKGFDAPEKKGRGRPKGSTNKPKDEDEAF